jgi:hypothetical protein
MSAWSQGRKVDQTDFVDVEPMLLILRQHDVAGTREQIQVARALAYIHQRIFAAGRREVSPVEPRRTRHQGERMTRFHQLQEWTCSPPTARSIVMPIWMAATIAAEATDRTAATPTPHRRRRRVV